MTRWVLREEPEISLPRQRGKIAALQPESR